MPPSILYKYGTPRGVDILRNLRLKITPPNQFNDPFELAPRMEEQLTREKAFEALTEPRILTKTYQDLIKTNQFVGTFEQFLDAIRDHSELLAGDLIASYPESAADFRRTHINTVSAEFGLLCLSAVPNDILMWSHYTRSHYGLVIGLKTSHEFFANPPLLDVVYNQERVLMGQSVLREDPKRAEQINALIRRKSPHWSYEQEWRQLYFLQLCTAETDQNDGSITYFKPFSGDLVSEVILGCRLDSNLEKEIRDLLTRDHFSGVKLSKYQMHDSEFSLVAAS